MAPGDITVDTGGEFHLPSCLAVVRRSRAGREETRRPHLTVLAHEHPQCHSIPDRTPRSPTRPSVWLTPPFPRAPSASASPTTSDGSTVTTSSPTCSPPADSRPPPPHGSPSSPCSSTSKASLIARPPTPSVAASTGNTPWAWNSTLSVMLLKRGRGQGLPGVAVAIGAPRPLHPMAP